MGWTTCKRRRGEASRFLVAPLVALARVASPVSLRATERPLSTYAPSRPRHGATTRSREPQLTVLARADGGEVFVEVQESQQTFPACHPLQRFGFLLLDGFREREHLSDLCFRSHDDTVIIAEDDIARHDRHPTARDRDLRRKNVRSASRERKNGTAIHRELHGADGGHIAHGAVDHNT